MRRAGEGLSGSAAVRAALAGVRPNTAAALQGWLRAALGIRVPRRARCAGHTSPMAYLEHVFFERPGDVIVWANRGGGKTFYGAVATLLDLLFKPGVEVRILGGSLEQSRKMYEHLRWMLDRPGFCELVSGKMTHEGVALRNGSRVELLAQSQTSVRGERVQKLRCDEVELFDPEVWEAAQYVTRSAVCGGVAVRGSVEAMSTLHRPFGLMHELVRAAGEGESRRVMRWCALDVMARCTEGKACAGCAIEPYCRGRAKRWRGFLSVEDVEAQRRRTSRESFEAEMLCMRPSRCDAVFAMFSPERHVREVEARRDVRWVGGVDFGLHNPFVMLWGQLAPGRERGVRVEIVDEYVMENRRTLEHLEEMARRPWPRPVWLGVDPAGHSRSAQTMISEISLCRRAGWSVRDARSRIVQGIEVIRRRLENAGGDDGLVIHPRCRRLIESLTCYAYDPQKPHSENPRKDGRYDHAVDALRYMLVNLESSGEVKVGRY